MTVTTVTAPRGTAGAARRLTLPLGIAVGAGLLTMLLGVMGVPWTSAGEGSSGIRLQADDNQGTALTVSAIDPGQSVSRSVTIRNSGAQASRLSFQETGDPSSFADGLLHLAIVQDGRTLFDGDFAAMSDIAQDVGTLEPGGSSTFTFTVSLPDDAPFANQGEPASASYNWVHSGSGSTTSSGGPG